MKSIFTAIAVCAFALPLHAEPTLDREAVNQAGYTGGKPSPAQVLKLQVLLDRAGFSPGVIDAVEGMNLEVALKAFEQKAGLAADGKTDAEVWKALTADTSEVLTTYRLTEDDVKGPFVKKIPEDYAEIAKMEALSYTSPAELLSEKFHMDVELLKTLNPESKFDEAGEEIVIADVGTKVDKRVDRIEVHKLERLVLAFSQDELVAAYPATIGSESTPSPSGTMEVEGVAKNPDYSYDPEEHAGKHGDKPLILPPGPNGPVGTVWIELTKETYGIHGTPEPQLIGRSSSAGCVRLTNWDAEELAALVRPGTDVTFLED
jgi:lipoprotein-anchoring transpeptidase ErfK/SrfK